ncbi:E3 ubiquitin-protein ligase mib1 [Geodia barretti]|uniref:RING-type E3 ubiquitin transferase n=1 Tax=Geodia barretti TaxID=519541 RepID=A0AA35RKH3_GEOBA|nr:E3 ubiquitin-protein ligase mib1 [Geodia barretti]
MIHTLGKVGRIAEVYGDGDLKIDVKGTMWTFNSQAVRKVDGNGMPLTPSTSANVSQLLRHMFEEHQSVRQGRAGEVCGQRDVSRVGGPLTRRRGRVGRRAVNEVRSPDCQSGILVRHVVQNGHIEIVKCLLRNGANIEEEDKDGDRAVHHASFGDEPEVVDLLSSNSADLNARKQETSDSASGL